MLDNKAIRRMNVHLLEKEIGSLTELGKLAGTTQSYLSQCKTAARSVGDDVARRLESGTKKTHGWMDEPHIADEHRMDARRIYEELLMLPRAKLEAVATLLDIGPRGDNKKKKEKKGLAPATKSKGNGLRGSA